MTAINSDQSELDKFETAADSWWDLDGEFSALHRLNPLRSDFIDNFSDGVEGKTLVDIGCGGGILCEEMARRGAIVTGIDLGANPLRVANAHAEGEQLSISYIKTSAEELAANPKTANSFDVVTCLEMLEHVPDPASVVKAAAALCKPGGHLFFATISRTTKAYALMVLGAEYVLRLVPKGTHDYNKFITPAELASWLRAASLNLEQSTGVSYNPIAKRFRLESHDLDVNYMLHASKPVEE